MCQAELPDDLPEFRPITLSERDWDAFIAVLDNPPAPNDALTKLMAEFGPWKDQGTFTVGE